MCGIAAVFNCENSKAMILASLEKIQHRGGKLFEFEQIGNAALGANRLPIIGRQSGKQPVYNEDKTLLVVQNGEIFNYKQLRSELINLGHKFHTDTDTEVLIHAYEAYGTKMVEHLDSEMFAFVIYNKETNEVFAARDALGVKPLYYAKAENGELHFASELKQLCQFQHLTDIHEFPAGHYFHKGKFFRYFSIKLQKSKLSESSAITLLEKEIVQAVKKRVDTDLPIGVFLSGGVDSSLIMEIATRLHPDVTAIILGTHESPDYQYAIRLCQDRNYKHHVIQPHVDYERDLDEVLYHLESYEPLIVRQTFANWICSREAQRLGLNIVLVGEGADELFAGYNEFSSLSASDINKGCKILTENLGRGHLKRVDRASMRFTIEIRAPFLDNAVVKTAFAINGTSKLHREQHRLTTKYVLRKVASKFLPSYTAWRYKMPFANGAGMDVGYNFQAQDGELARFIKNKYVELTPNIIDLFDAKTDEEKYLTEKYISFDYHKLAGSEKRTIVKDTLYKLRRSSKHRLVIAEFDKLALYFPVYLAAANKIFELHNLDVDFISTGGDEETYASLRNNSAQIGLSDPLFTMFENSLNKENKGEIIGQMVSSAPIVAVTINPTIHIKTLADFINYKIGTFHSLTTTHTIASSLLGMDNIQTFAYNKVIDALEARDVEIAIVLAEQAFELIPRGGRIVFEFNSILPNYFFTGFSVSGHIEQRHQKQLVPFIASIRESMQWIRHHPEQALRIFQTIFPEIAEADQVLKYYHKFWQKDLKVKNEDYFKARSTWHRVHPHILKSTLPYFRTFSIADAILDIINKKKYRREYPFLEDHIRGKIEKGKPLELVGFWGASAKKTIDRHDTATMVHFESFIEEIKNAYAPGVTATFILADKHAENNGYSPESYSPYLQAIGKSLRRLGFQTIYLSELWKKWEISPETVLVNLSKRQHSWWDKISINKNLESQSEHNFMGLDTVFGAQKYYAMREMEKTMLEKEFKSQIFIVYGNSLMQQIYPHLPTLYLWTEKAFYSPCPWFSNK